MGSPPRMRGKPSYSKYVAQLLRITPADAGKTTYSANYQCASKDHPRGCGENAFFANLSRLRPGSPPRMRGKLVEDALNSGSLGITPADAGKTAGL